MDDPMMQRSTTLTSNGEAKGTGMRAATLTILAVALLLLVGPVSAQDATPFFVETSPPPASLPRSAARWLTKLKADPANARIKIGRVQLSALGDAPSSISFNVAPAPPISAKG